MNCDLGLQVLQNLLGQVSGRHGVAPRGDGKGRWIARGGRRIVVRDRDAPLLAEVFLDRLDLIGR